MYSRRDLSLVFTMFGNVRGVKNFRMQTYKENQFLTFWEGRPSAGHGFGHGIMYENQYRLAYNLSIKAMRTEADSHEFQLTEDGGAMSTAYEMIRGYDLTSIGGPSDGVLLDSCFEEIDMETGKMRFTWRASERFPITDTAVPYHGSDYGHLTIERGFDYFHINSFEKTRDGNYLVLGRRLRVVTLYQRYDRGADLASGREEQRVHGLVGGRATHFGYQHHSRFDEEYQTEIVMFENAEINGTQPSPGCQDKCSRGLHIRLDHQAKAAEVVKEYYHPGSVQARAEGWAERQSNGNILVGWGKIPDFTEYTQEGEVVLDVRTGPWEGGQGHIYRIYSSDWKGYPTWDPEIAVYDGDICVSWNGASELAHWALVSALYPKTPR